MNEQKQKVTVATFTNVRLITGRFDTSIFSRGVHSSMYLGNRTKNIHPKYFSCSRANYTWSERCFRAISLLEFVSKTLISKRLCIATTSFRSVQFGLRNTVAQPRWYPECTDWPETVIAENFSWISLCTDVPPPSEKLGEEKSLFLLPIFSEGGDVSLLRRPSWGFVPRSCPTRLTDSLLTPGGGGYSHSLTIRKLRENELDHSLLLYGYVPPKGVVILKLLI